MANRVVSYGGQNLLNNSTALSTKRLMSLRRADVTRLDTAFLLLLLSSATRKTNLHDHQKLRMGIAPTGTPTAQPLSSCLHGTFAEKTRDILLGSCMIRMSIWTRFSKLLQATL